MPAGFRQLHVEYAPTPATTINVPIKAMNTVAYWTAGQNVTVNFIGTQRAGMRVSLIITLDGTPRTITFGTGILGSITSFLGTINKKHVVAFVSDGTTFNQMEIVHIQL